VLGQQLAVIPSGPLPPNPSDLLSLNRFEQLIDEIGQSVDVVLVDTPPVLVVTDPLVVAPNVDGVAVVCRAGRTRIDALRRTAATLAQGDVRLVGVVLNQQTGRDAEGYYYYYYAGYYGEDEGKGLGTRRAPPGDALPEHPGAPAG
jgi:non-specific protein-tyrosine kinase